MPQTTTVHSWKVSFEENAREGIRYLRDELDDKEAKVFFDQARQKGAVYFEDDDSRDFTHFYKNSAYTLVRR